nr:DUF2946 domain-containing protein [Photorhabdus khanii]
MCSLQNRLGLSLIQIYTSRSRLSACLGIFAILMLFIAPVISRSLEHARVGESHSDIASASPGTNHHDGMQMGMHAGNGMSMLDDIACGYCVFLIHVPLLDLANTPLFWSTSLTSRSPPVQPVALFLAHFIFSDSLPRAPPE